MPPSGPEPKSTEGPPCVRMGGHRDPPGGADADKVLRRIRLRGSMRTPPLAVYLFGDGGVAKRAAKRPFVCMGRVPIALLTTLLVAILSPEVRHGPPGVQSRRGRCLQHRPMCACIGGRVGVHASWATRQNARIHHARSVKLLGAPLATCKQSVVAKRRLIGIAASPSSVVPRFQWCLAMRRFGAVQPR